MIENDQIKILAGVANEYPFGLHNEIFSFPAYYIGKVKYNYGIDCYLDDQCDDGNSYTDPDTCNLSDNEW